MADRPKLTTNSRSPERGTITAWVESAVSHVTQRIDDDAVRMPGEFVPVAPAIRTCPRRRSPSMVAIGNWASMCRVSRGSPRPKRPDSQRGDSGAPPSLGAALGRRVMKRFMVGMRAASNSFVRTPDAVLPAVAHRRGR